MSDQSVYQHALSRMQPGKVMRVDDFESPTVAYEQKVMTNLVNLMLDATLLDMRPLPARRVFASHWRVLHIDGFKEMQERTRQLFWWPTQYISSEDCKLIHGEPDAATSSPFAEHV